jgi:hypothetical protein
LLVTRLVVTTDIGAVDLLLEPQFGVRAGIGRGAVRARQRLLRGISARVTFLNCVRIRAIHSSRTDELTVVVHGRVVASGNRCFIASEQTSFVDWAGHT